MECGDRMLSLVSLLSFPLPSLVARSEKFKMSEAALFVFGLIDGAALLFLTVYFVSFGHLILFKFMNALLNNESG